MTDNNRLFRPRLLSILLTFAAASAVAKSEVPQTTPDGLELLKQTRSRITYAMPDATLELYTKVALIDCAVAFAKNWDRDYNRNVSLSRRIRPDDMEKIKAHLAEEFETVFTEELTKAGHEIVGHTGDDVLVIRPAIINLEITAPDVGDAGMTRVYVRSAGRMTLYMELYDSVTGAKIAQVMDAEAADRGFAMQANRVMNKSEADRVLRGWARELAEHLGPVREEAASGGVE